MVVQRWVTGDKAEKDEDEIQRELDVLMRELMELSGQRKFFGHKNNPTRDRQRIMEARALAYRQTRHQI